MKFSRIATVLMLGFALCLWVTGCGQRPPRDVPVTFALGGKLHVFASPDHLAQAGLPQDAKTFIIGTGAIADKAIDLGEGVQTIQRLKIKITYEYHADTSNNPATLEFVIKDSDGKSIGAPLTQDFRPSTRNTQLDNEFVFDINRAYTKRDVTIQVKPVSAGDFGFFIYALSGTLTVR
ncbi:hypothetical protein FGF66_10655 [Chlorobaculum thiosulfatiphilum]|jgi:hypothetical protein|uniref:Lipoprotein n=1 Tax=Chlorobaculum thiosulfatiphilum TaxID=115852 RepID=A0A5C4S2X6_CHLTI|nr:hypothetical protein [Chlorobaculum thiosulfatiphilum]TNJ37492.1 hypothetical protein FGF66_10655 [Chlorobaculum thiosulfatiphilum]